MWIWWEAQRSSWKVRLRLSILPKCNFNLSFPQADANIQLNVIFQCLCLGVTHYKVNKGISQFFSLSFSFNICHSVVNTEMDDSICFSVLF